MEKKLFIILFCFLSIGCNKKETKIELPNQLKWGMSVDDVKHKEIDISERRESADHDYQYYDIKSTTSPEQDSALAAFKKNEGLISYTQNIFYSPSPDAFGDKNYDPNGEKAISLYNSYISQFDKLYYSSSANENIEPYDDFWGKPSCEGERFCTISEKIYTDNIDTVLKVNLFVLKAENSINNVGFLGIYYSKKNNKSN